MEEIKKLQEILMNCWPAHYYYFLNGWVMCFTEGVTSRANSVFPLNYTGDTYSLERDIKFVEKAYQACNLPTIFTIPDYFEPKNLDVKLIEHGYQQLGCITHTMIITVQGLRNEINNDEFSYIFHSERVNKISTFLSKFSKRDLQSQNVLDRLANRIIIPQKRYIVAEYGNKVVGTLMGILDPHGFLYLAEVLVDPDFRQQKIATSMYFKTINEWGIPNGVKKIWLQVEIENMEAMNLYTKLGFEKAYSYYYLEKP